MKTNISIIICTYNRAESLSVTLDSIIKMVMPTEITLETLIVDNNSSDNTKQIAEKYSKNIELNIKYVFESKQGKSYALNAGISHATGDILVFTDDDVIVDPNWIKEIAYAFEEYDADCVGGKILPIWPLEKPSWLSREIEYVLAILDYGDDILVMSANDGVFYGANVAYSRRILEKVGKYDTSRGRTGDKLYSGEDTEMHMRVVEANGKVLYLPSSVVNHVINANRVKKKYFRKWHFDAGVGTGISLKIYKKRNIFGIPYYIVCELIEHVFKYFVTFVKIDRRKVFLKELRVLYYLGFVYARLK